MGSVGTSKSTYLYNNLYVEGTALNQNNADTVVRAVRDVLNDFGLNDELRGVYFNPKGTIIRGDASASMNGLGDLTISNAYLLTKEGTRSSVMSDTFYGTGAHEAGHAVVNGLLKSLDIEAPGVSTNLARATARSLGKLEKEIIKEASKRYGSNPVLSKYGSTNVKEKVAEAVSDVYSNKNSNTYSRTIVQVMKDIKTGKFKPKIKVTKRQAGI